jgi:hypothetical protein
VLSSDSLDRVVVFAIGLVVLLAPVLLVVITLEFLILTGDIVLSDAIPVYAKLLRYWRANGDPEPNWYKHVFSPFNRNTLLTDAKRLHESEFEKPGGLLGLFYKRASDDPDSVEEFPEKFEASELAEKVVEDIEYWYEFDIEVCEIAPFRGLQHEIHQQGATITWVVD